MAVAVQWGNSMTCTGCDMGWGWGCVCGGAGYAVQCGMQRTAQRALAQSAIAAAAEERRARSERSAVSPCGVTALCHCHRCVFLPPHPPCCVTAPCPRAAVTPHGPTGRRGGGARFAGTARAVGGPQRSGAVRCGAGMAGLSLPGLFVPWLCLQLMGTSAFNLDAANTVLKDGTRGSLFGFSVALHRQLSPEPASW